MSGSDYGAGWRRAHMAAQGVGFEPTPHLDGDQFQRFVENTMALVLKDKRDDEVSEDFMSGVGEGAVAAWECRMQQEKNNGC